MAMSSYLYGAMYLPFLRAKCSFDVWFAKALMSEKEIIVKITLKIN